MKAIIFILYFFNLICIWSVFYVFATAKNGGLRIAMMWFFGCLTFGFLIAMLNFVTKYDNDIVRIVAVLPVTAASINLICYLRNHYKN